MKKGWMALCLAPFALVGVLLILGTVRAWHDHRLLARSGEVITGRVVGTWVNTDSEGDDTPYAAYTFEIDGTAYEGRSIIGWDSYEEFEKGTPVNILFAAERPSVNRLQAAYGVGDPIMITLFAVFWNGFLAFFLKAFWKDHS